MTTKNNNPLISIITVVKNDHKSIGGTIKSVITQKYDNYEYIIIDGRSNDGTIDIISGYLNNIDYFCSEPALGIYDAMNKGLKMARGEYVFFINAGDSFFDNRVLRDVSSVLEKNKPDVLSAQVSYYDKQYDSSWVRGGWITLANLKKGGSINHQSIFIKRCLMNDFNGFNIEYRLAADFDLICQLVAAEKKVFYLQRIISNYLLGGASSAFYDLFIEKAKIIRNHYGSGYYILFKIKKYFALTICKLLNVCGLLPIYYRLKYFRLSCIKK